MVETPQLPAHLSPTTTCPHPPTQAHLEGDLCLQNDTEGIRAVSSALGVLGKPGKRESGQKDSGWGADSLRLALRPPWFPEPQ